MHKHFLRVNLRFMRYSGWMEKRHGVLANVMAHDIIKSAFEPQSRYSVHSSPPRAICACAHIHRHSNTDTYTLTHTYTYTPTDTHIHKDTWI